MMAKRLDELENKELVIQNMSWSSDETQIALSKSIFIDIPNEIILYIFRFFSVHDLCNISLVCRSFKMIADHDELWKFKCNTSIKLHSKSYRQIYMEWIHEKSLRNQKLKQFEREFMFRTACIRRPPPPYPIRPASEYRFQSLGGFTQHPNSTQELTIKLSVNIDKTIPELIIFLKTAIRCQEQWQQSVILKQMIQRYYRFMQLKASHPPNTLLIPTLDIEIVWQTHLLRPEIYRNDCLRLFHRIINHSLIIENEIERFCKEQAFFDTCQLYEEKFREKYCELPLLTEKQIFTLKDSHTVYKSIVDNKPICSYWNKTYFKFSLNSSNDYENPFSFTEGDIILDLKWFDLCKEFMSNVIKRVPVQQSDFYGPLGIDVRSGAIKRLKKSYERFLYMAAKYPLNDVNGFISPTYAIDIVWHSHMQEPLNYEADCLRLVGYIIYHDPWPIVEDEKMNKSCEVIDQIWRDEFQCSIETDHLYNTSDNTDDWFG